MRWQLALAGIVVVFFTTTCGTQKPELVAASVRDVELQYPSSWVPSAVSEDGDVGFDALKLSSPGNVWVVITVYHRSFARSSESVADVWQEVRRKMVSSRTTVSGVELGDLRVSESGRTRRRIGSASVEGHLRRFDVVFPGLSVPFESSSYVLTCEDRTMTFVDQYPRATSRKEKEELARIYESVAFSCPAASTP